MRKFLLLITVSIISFIAVPVSTAFFPGMSNSEIIEKLRIKESEIPGNFIYGKVPDHAKHIFRDNPWTMDPRILQKISGNIYPEGDAGAMEAVHVTILAESGKPYRDDLVCYILIYKNKKMAEFEFSKLEEFSIYNSARTSVFRRENIAVYLHSDNAENYKYIEELSEFLRKKMELL